MKTIPELVRAKRGERAVTMVTAYDVLTARTIADSDVDVILVGDSAAMVVHGFDSTIHATVEMMCLHTAAVRRGASAKIVVADMPFLSVRRGRDAAVDAAGALIRAGANAVKVEGVEGHADVIAHLATSGIPVMGHLGLVPQSVHQIGYRVQGREPAAADRIRSDALELQRAGAFAVVLECIPAALAKKLTRELEMLTIGIGAGAETDGQVLVSTDLLGMDARFRPSFARCYMNGHESVLRALNAFAQDVRENRFPSSEEIPA